MALKREDNKERFITRGKRKNRMVAGVGFEPTTSGLLAHSILQDMYQKMLLFLCIPSSKISRKKKTRKMVKYFHF